MAIKQVKPGLYMVTGFGGNSLVRVTDQGVILVDTKNLGDGPFNDLVAQIKTVTNQPVKHVFITHVHQDHSGNIGRFIRAGAEVITHEGLKRNLETGGLDGKGYTAPAGKPDPPSVTYSDQPRGEARQRRREGLSLCQRAHRRRLRGAVSRPAGHRVWRRVRQPAAECRPARTAAAC